MGMNKWFFRLSFYLLAIMFGHFLVLTFIWSGKLPQDAEDMYVKMMSTFLLSFVFLAAVIYYFIRQWINPLKEISALLKDLSEGHYWRRIHLGGENSVLDDLAAYANQLASRLQTATEHESMQATRLEAIIRHMGSGLLYINDKGRIIITNEMLVQLLGWSDDYSGYIYYEAPLSGDIVAVIKDAFEMEDEINKQITLEKETERLEINLSVVPLKDHERRVTGIVLVFHDITDLKRLEETRKDFVANVSHELKTPVTSIKGFSETLLDGAMHSEAHLKEFLEIIRQESDRLYRLIQELLDLSHIEQGRFQLHWEKIDLRELVRDTLALVRSKAEGKHIRLQTVMNESATIEGDADRLRQILLNLVSNAIQYTPEHGLVLIRLQEWEDKGYSICVQDNGVGMSEKDLPRIFERFYRVDRARSRASGGTGLGLAIVKHLVEAHHGEIKVTSEEGKGSTFCVYFYKQKPETSR